MNDPRNNPIDVSGSAGDDDRIMPTAPGAQLAAYRQEQGWTVEQVASQLNLAPRQVVAIESDDYPSLPGMPIVRGFIRSYAKLLKIDAAPLLVSLGGETMFVQAQPISPRKTLSAPFSETRLPSMLDRPGISSKWLVGLLFVVLLGVAVWATQKNGELAGMSKSASTQIRDGIAHLSGSDSAPKTDAGKAPGIAAASTASNGEASMPAMVAPVSGADTPVSMVPGGSTPEPAASTASQSAPAQSASSPAAMSAPVPTVPPAQASTERNPTATAQVTEPASNKDSLVLTAKQDSWIEVKSVSKKAVLLARLVKAGTTETVAVSEPVSVVIGNAAGVEVSLRGAPVDIKGGAGNVARLNLK